MEVASASLVKGPVAIIAIPFFGNRLRLFAPQFYKRLGSNGIRNLGRKHIAIYRERVSAWRHAPSERP